MVRFRLARSGRDRHAHPHGDRAGTAARVRHLMPVAVVASLGASLLGVVVDGTAAAANPGKPSCVDARAGVAAAAALAKACHRRVEVSSARSETAQTFANADGSMTLEESVQPRWARRDDGSWAAVDVSLRRAADGTVRPAATVVRMVFSGGGGAPLARLVDGDRELSVSWPTALPVPSLEGDSAVYAGVLPDVDLRVTASS